MSTVPAGVGAVLKERVRAERADGRFESADELRQVLDRLLSDIDADPEAGPALRSANVPHRFVFPDLGVTLNVAGSELPGHCLRWGFGDEEDWAPALSMEMSSEVANRFLQGRENLAIAMARTRIRVSCSQARAALSFLPTSRALIGRYKAIIERDYPHLLVH